MNTIIEQKTTKQIDQQIAHLHVLTTAELNLLMITIAHCLYERGAFMALPEANQHPTINQETDLDTEFDEIDHELDRAKIQRWLIVVLNIALSILIELMF